MRNAVVFPVAVKNVFPVALVVTALTEPRFEPRTLLAPIGACGTARGVTVADVADGRLVPAKFVAVTVTE
jgi:hypothetical protein